MTLAVSGADEPAEGPRTRVSFRCTLHVEESGSDWPNALGRAKAAFVGTHPTDADLFGWSLGNRTGRMIVSLETTIDEDACRISASMRSRTVSELVVDAVLLVESDGDASPDEVADDARGAVDAFFTKDAVSLAPYSPGGGVVLASIVVDQARQIGVEDSDGHGARG